MSVQIRKGVVSDATELAAFAARTFADTFGADNRPEHLKAHLESSYGTVHQTEELENPDTVTLLAYAETALVAYAQLRRETPPPFVVADRAIQLHRFYVDRAVHGRGIAQALMGAVHAHVRELGGTHIWLTVWERNPRAIAFYRKAGFVDVGSTDFYVGADRQTDRVFVVEVAEPLASA